MIRTIIGLVALIGLAGGAWPAAAAPPCGPVASHAAGKTAEALASAALDMVERAARSAVTEAGAASQARYATSRFRTGPGPCVAELTRMAALRLASVSGHAAFSAEARLLTAVDPAKLGAAFDGWLHNGAAEARAVGDLAVQLAAFGASYPRLRIYIVRAAGAAASSAGIAFVDPATREAVWIHGWAQGESVIHRTE